MKRIEEIQEAVRALRDDDAHVCQADEENGGDGGECTCHGYDAVIDDLEELKEEAEMLKDIIKHSNKEIDTLKAVIEKNMCHVYDVEAIKEGMKEQGITAENVNDGMLDGWTNAFCDTLETLYQLEHLVCLAFEKEASKKYTVWVGGTEVNDNLLTKEEAEEVARGYKDNGYDDVVIDEYKHGRK